MCHNWEKYVSGSREMAQNGTKWHKMTQKRKSVRNTQSKSKNRNWHVSCINKNIKTERRKEM